jgi:glycosyltransferase involved in cell wall biosynthesis
VTANAHGPQQALSGTRIALVCAHFSPEIGYQEVDLAAAFARLGAELLVVTSTRPSRNARAAVKGSYPAGMTCDSRYGLLRLEPRFTVGANVLGCKVLPAISDFAPDDIVLVGPGKLFGLDVFAPRSAPWKRIAIVQDNSQDGRSSGPAARRALRTLAHPLFKRPAYRRVVRTADRIVLNVPETREIVSGWLNEPDRALLSEKAIDLRLGFDPETFFYDREGRRRWRENYEIGEEEILLVTCTRATPEKRLERVVETVSRFLKRGLPVRYVMAGVLDDAHGRLLREQVASLEDASGVLLLPVLRHDEMRELFSACDLGFWPRVAITIQQAMGTGLPVVLQQGPTVSHLLLDGQNGWYVDAGQTVEQVLGEAVTVLSDMDAAGREVRRDATARLNREHLSYDRIALEIVLGLRQAKAAAVEEPDSGQVQG